MSNINVKIPGVKIDFGGDVRVVPPLSLGSLKKLGDRLQNVKNGVDAESVQTVLDAAFLSLKRNYPDITEEEVGEMVDLSNMQEVMQSIMDVSGLRRKAQLEAEQGEAGTSQ
jgi:hypothetical protein